MGDRVGPGYEPPGLYIHIAIPSLERIGQMQDREELRRLLKSAGQAAWDLGRYQQALACRLADLVEQSAGGTPALREFIKTG